VGPRLCHVRQTHRETLDPAVTFLFSRVSRRHCTALHCTALHCTALHCTALHCTALHCTVPHCTALHCTALHCTALHYILPVIMESRNSRSNKIQISLYAGDLKGNIRESQGGVHPLHSLSDISSYIPQPKSGLNHKIYFGTIYTSHSFSSRIQCLYSVLLRLHSKGL
jgi:hypothetical protein